MESLKIVFASIAAAILYGIVHDQFTARICVEYFTVFHPPVFATRSPTLLGIGWGIIATWWVGALLGLVLALVALSTIALTATDFLFKSAVAARIEPRRLGSFFADVSLVLNGLSLVAQVFGVGLLLRALRVNRALAVMPFLLLLSALGVVAAPALAAALVLRGVDGTMRHSLHKTTTEILFVPLPPGRTKSLIELFGQRGGQILASICLLPLFALGGERALGVAVAALAAAWLLQAITIKKPYLDIFRKTLKEGRFEDAGALPMLDVSALETLFAALNSDKDPEVLGALDLLAAQDRARLVPALILYHPSKPIVLRALGLLVAEKRQDFVPIADRLLHLNPPWTPAAEQMLGRCSPDSDRRVDRCPAVRARHREPLQQRRGGGVPDLDVRRGRDRERNPDSVGPGSLAPVGMVDDISRLPSARHQLLN